MKKVLFTFSLMLVASFSFAQVKTVKEAKGIVMGTNPDFNKAEKLINGALTNPETKDNPDTWDVAGLIQKKKSEKQMENAYLRKPYDTATVYSCALKMTEYYFKCDDLAQIPNEKGKVKNKYRKANAAIVNGERANLINGGVYYFNKSMEMDEAKAKQCDAEALKYFAAYVDGATHPLMSELNLLQTDTLLPQIAYYASLAAMKVEDYAAVLKYAPYAQDDKEVGMNAMEFISSALKEQGDTVKWIASLKEGIKKYPTHQFFFGHLVDYYSNKGQYDEAMAYADQLVAESPNDKFFLYVKAYLHHNMKDYDNAITYYIKATEADPEYVEAYSNLGLVYCLQAQDYSEKMTSDYNDPKYKEEQKVLKEFYVKAKPCYEKARALRPEQKDLWLNGLYRIYYNLDMGDEFKEIESLMPRQE